MCVGSPARTIEEYLDWEAQQEQRFEYREGQAVEVEGSTQARSLLITDIAALIRPWLRGSNLILLTGMRVLLPLIEEVRYPALLIHARPFDPHATEAANPAVSSTLDACAIGLL